jgi:hypothetical protein
MTSPRARELARWVRTRATVILLRDAALAGEFVLNPGETPAAEPPVKSRSVPIRPRAILILPQRHRELRKIVGMIVRRPAQH